MSVVPAAHIGTPPSERSRAHAPAAAIRDAARFLDAAVSAHLARRFDLAQELILLADLPELRSGVTELDPIHESVSERSPVERQRLLTEHRHHCRLCGSPVIAPETRDRIKNIYHQVLRWGRTAKDRHAALWRMTARFHELDKGTLIVSCTSCLPLSADCTVEALCLEGLCTQAPNPSNWDGLDRFR